MEERILLPFDSEGGQRRLRLSQGSKPAAGNLGAVVWRAKRFRVATRPLGVCGGVAVKEAAAGSSVSPIDSEMPHRAVVTQLLKLAGHITPVPGTMK